MNNRGGYTIFLGFFVINLSSSHLAQIPRFVDNYGFENIRPGKWGLIAIGHGFTYIRADQDCKAIGPGVSLFTVESEDDSRWLGERINIEKNRVSGSSKFWVGLNSHGANGQLKWTTGSEYVNYPEVVQISGQDDHSKMYAWAIPDGMNTKLKYEFLTSEDEAEAYICQYSQI